MRDRIKFMRWPLALIVLAGIFCLGGRVLGRDAPDTKPAIIEVLRARKIEVVDAQGRTRVVMSSFLPDARGQHCTGLMIQSPNKRVRIILGTSTLGTMLILADHQGVPRSQLHLDPKTGEPALHLTNERGKQQLMASVQHDGARLILFDRTERPCVAIGALKGEGSVSVLGKKGKGDILMPR